MSGGRKFDKSKYKDLRDFKSKEIKKSLIHRANLRKNYFKLLQKEDPERYKQELQKEKERDEEDQKEKHKHKSHNKTQSDHPDRATKRLTYAEKAQLVKQRKEEKRKEALEQVADKKRRIEKAQKDRETQKKRIGKRTRNGQPLMGPRINTLLDKIQKDME